MESCKAKDHGSLWVENPRRGGECQEVYGGGNAQVGDEVRFPYATGAGTVYSNRSRQECHKGTGEGGGD